MYRLAKVLLLGAVLNGLCPPVLANTTMAELAGAASTAPAATEPPYLNWIAQTDLSIPRDVVFAQDDATAAPVTTARIALLLPLHSDALRTAADAVRAGFLAAHELERDGISVTVIETGDAPYDIVSSYTVAAENHDIVVGPLSRSGVAALAQSGTVRKPTIALTQPEATPDAELQLPQQLLAVGLSIENEARQVANWAGRNKKISKAVVISTNTAWQQRAASAFGEQWQKQGKELELYELTSHSGYLGARELEQLREQFEFDPPGLLFAALDEKQVRQLRVALGTQIPIYGTSQLNPFSLADWSAGQRASEMDGVRLLDIPWQLQADHPAVMVYPRPAAGAEQRRSADLERLYALGIDAYRVAREIAAKRTSFEIDGVTGKLTVRFGQGAPYFQRREPQAIYRGGSVVAVSDSR